MRRFAQVDVFTATPYQGNPVAVVLDGDGLDTEQMQRFARWTNLSETTFVLAPTDPGADYRVRIFTPGAELPFAGHPTIGTCHAWLEAGGTPADDGAVVQECGIGPVLLRRTERLAFSAPELARSGPVDDELVDRACGILAIERDAVVDAQWCDNGPSWLGIRLRSAAEVLAITPDYGAEPHEGIGVLDRHAIGVVGPHEPGPDDAPAIEVRAFFSAAGRPTEDPVTGSLNAALAQWLLGDGTLTAPYVAAQGTAMGRAGRVHVTTDADHIWIGGDAVTCISGTVVI